MSGTESLRYIGDENKAGRDSQVEGECTILEKCTEELIGVAEGLEKRLSSVLRPQEAKAGKDEPEQQLVPLADRIRNSRRNVEDGVERLSSILSRLEI